MLKPSEIERLSMAMDEPMRRLENEIMTDIIRRIKENGGEISRAADWQIYRLHELGMAQEDIDKAIKKALNYSDEEMQEMYRNVIAEGYAYDSKLYKAAGVPRVPFEDNLSLQQLINAVGTQTANEFKNYTQSLGFAIRNPNGTITYQPIATYYQQTLDNAVMGIASGVFDYNTVINKTVAEMTNSGLRTVDYDSGWSNRIDVAARRAIMTGLSQITAKVNESNANELGTDTYEVSWHSGARPAHQVWQGKWYTHQQLIDICGLGTVTGLCGANCYHDYYPVIPGISEPTYTAEEVRRMNAEENKKTEFRGKQYTKYEALQRQRKLETTMRAQRQKIRLLEEGGADEDDILAARGRYRVTSAEYARFSNAMDLPQQRERVTVDGLGNIGVGKWKKAVDKSAKNGIIKTKEEAYDYLNSVFGSIEKSISMLDEHLVVENTEQLRKLNERFGILTNDNIGYISGSRIKAAAETYSSLTEHKYNLTLSSKYYKAADTLLETENYWQKINFSMPVSDEYLSVATVTHEYGHMLQNELIRNRINPAIFEQYNLLRLAGNRNGAMHLLHQEEKEQAKNMYDEIIGIVKERNPDIKLSEQISKYGKSSYYEAFAEIFMNSQCGAPNELGKAMNIFLERSGYV